MMKRTVITAMMCLAIISIANAEPGNGIHAGPWTFSPYANLRETYDSNVDKTPVNKVDDFFLDSEAGLKMGYSAYAIDFSGLGFLGNRNYSDLTDKDFSSGGEILKFKQGTHDTFVIEADQTFRRVEDNDLHGSEAAVLGVSPDSVLDSSSTSRRDINNVGVSVGRNLTDKMVLDVGYRFDDVNYSDPTIYDIQNHIGQAEGAYRLTEKTDSLVTMQAGMQDNGVISDPANYYIGRVGLKTRGTDKVIFKGGVGVQLYERPIADDITSFSYDLSASWVATEKITLQAGGRNGTVLSSLYTDNGSEYNTVWAGASYRVIPTIILSANASYRQDDYLDPVAVQGGTKDRTDKGSGLGARVDYLTPAKFLRLYTEAQYQNVESTISPTYDETRIMLGMKLQY
ncbi:MAG: outer membrane beta-barrel protein [bacterium]